MEFDLSTVLAHLAVSASLSYAYLTMLKRGPPQRSSREHGMHSVLFLLYTANVGVYLIEISQHIKVVIA